MQGCRIPARRAPALLMAGLLVVGLPAVAPGWPGPGLHGGPACAASASPALDEQVWQGPVAPGIDLMVVRRLDGGGWLDLFAVWVDLRLPGVRLEALTGPALTVREPTRELAMRAGAQAAINGDFFYLGATGSPVGLVVREGELWKSPGPRERPALAVFEGRDGLVARIGTWWLEAAAVPAAGAAGAGEAAGMALPGPLAIDAWNETDVRPGQVAAYDAHWGPTPLPLARSPDGDVFHVRLVEEGEAWRVAEAGPGRAAPPGPGELILLGWRQGARRLAEHLAPGLRVRVEQRLVPADPPDVPAGRLVSAVSGGGWLVRGGSLASLSGLPGSPEHAHPRAAAAVDASGRRVLLLVIDGRRATSRGLTGTELAEWLVRLGAHDAIGLDGGDSATLVAEVGAGRLEVVNRPSAGAQRPVPVAIGAAYRPPPGAEGGPFVLKPGVGVQLGDPEGYSLPFRGLVTAAGVPSPIEVVPPLPPEHFGWSVDPPDLGYFSAPGRFVGTRPGEGRITAVLLGASPAPGDWQKAGSLLHPGDPLRQALESIGVRWAPVASMPVRVVGPPASLAIQPDPIPVGPEGSAEVALTVWGTDAQGHRAPIDPRLVSFWVEGGAAGSVRQAVLQVKLTRPGQPARLQARYLHLRTAVEVVGPHGPGGAGEAGQVGTSDGTGVFDDGPLGAGPQASGSRLAGEPPPDACTHADAPLRVAVMSRVPSGPLLEAAAAWLKERRVCLAVVRVDGVAVERADGLVLSGQLGLPVAAVRAAGSGAGVPFDEFRRRFGSASWVATRGATRFVAVDPAEAPWGWLAGQMRRAVAEGIRRLILVADRLPPEWPARREGQMVHEWLATLAGRGGLEVWGVGIRAGSGPGVQVRDGVRYARPPSPDGDEVSALLLAAGSGPMEARAGRIRAPAISPAAPDWPAVAGDPAPAAGGRQAGPPPAP